MDGPKRLRAIRSCTGGAKPEDPRALNGPSWKKEGGAGGVFAPSRTGGQDGPLVGPCSWWGGAPRVGCWLALQGLRLDVQGQAAFVMLFLFAVFYLCAIESLK